MTITKIFDPWTELPKFIESLDNNKTCKICQKYPVTQDNNTVCNQCIAKDPEQYDINSKTNVAKRFNK
jgi:hypothetical protein